MEKIAISIGVCLGLLCSANPSMSFEDIDSHLSEYSQHNIDQHGNINDEVVLHSHRHRHHDGGEEHEHHHQHLKPSSPDTKILKNATSITVPNSSAESKPISEEKRLVSDHHPIGVFRPPII